VHEIKHDGCRLIVGRGGKAVQLSLATNSLFGDLII
jgi:hypothetical protein